MKTLTDSEIELIEKYIDNSLSDSEVSLFHQKVQQSVEFSEQLELAQKAIKDIRKDYQPLTKKELFEIFEHSKKGIKKKTKIRKLSLIAAAISLILCSLFVLNDDSENIHQTLFMEYYQEYPTRPIFRDINQKDNLSMAIQAYERGQYKNALPLLLDQFSKESDLNLPIYIGNCFLAQDDMDQAIIFFKLAEQSSQEEIQAHAKWYLALSYLKSEKTQDSKETLASIIDLKQLYFKEAQALLNKIEDYQKTN